MIIGMKTFAVSCLTILSLVATPALAQFDANSLTGPELSIELQPEFPQPGETITATLNDYAGGTYGSSITWVLDNQELTNSKNQRRAIITAGVSGKQQVLKVVLSRPDGGNRVVSKNIKPAYLDIVIEPQTRVPDFYLGRALPSIGSQVNATALISGEGFRNTDLVYTWKINREVVEGGPIRGRNQVSFTTPMGSNAILSVQVTELSGAVIANRAILIPSVEPKVIFYEVNTLFGISQRPVTSSLSLIGNSVVVRAEPYNLDSRVYNNPTIHEWKIDNVSSGNTSGNPYEVTLQRQGFPGTSNIEFHVRDTVQLLQGAKASMKINF